MKKLAALTLSAAFLLAGCAAPRPAADTSPAPPPNVVALIDGQPLTLDRFEAEYTRTSGDPASAAQDSLAAYEDFLNRYVDFRLKVQSALDRGLADDPSVRAELAEYRGTLARPYLLEKTILDTLISQLYERQKEEVHASHLLINVAPFAAPSDTLAAHTRIAALRDSMLSGADFSAMAFAHSEDPSAKRNRGDLGYFTGGQMIAPFEDAAYASAVGDVSPIIRTRFGYHLLTVHDRVPRRGDIRASHILVRWPGSTAADSAAAREKIQIVQARLDAGEDFASVAAELSEDPGTARQGGDLGFFDRRRMVPAFSDAAFALSNVGDISGLVETQFGYHLIQLTDTKPLPSYEASYDKLKQLVMRLPRLESAELALGRVIRHERGVRVDTTLLRPNAVAFFSGKLATARNAQPFAHIGDSTFTLGQFADFASERSADAADAWTATLETLDDFLDRKGFDLAVASLEERDDAFSALMREFRDGILLFRVSEDSIWTAAQQDTLGLATYFEAHRADYQFPERKRVITFFSRSDSLMRLVAERLDAGERDPMALTGGSDEVRVDTTRLAGETQSLYDRALDKAVGERTDAMTYQRGFLLLYVDGIEAPRPKTLAEARAEIVSDYQQVLETRWLERLRARYDVHLFPERLVRAFADQRGAAVSSQ